MFFVFIFKEATVAKSKWLLCCNTLLRVTMFLLVSTVNCLRSPLEWTDTREDRPGGRCRL